MGSLLGWQQRMRKWLLTGLRLWGECQVLTLNRSIRGSSTVGDYTVADYTSNR